MDERIVNGVRLIPFDGSESELVSAGDIVRSLSSVWIDNGKRAVFRFVVYKGPNDEEETPALQYKETGAIMGYETYTNKKGQPYEKMLRFDKHNFGKNSRISAESARDYHKLYETKQIRQTAQALIDQYGTVEEGIKALGAGLLTIALDGKHERDKIAASNEIMKRLTGGRRRYNDKDGEKGENVLSDYAMGQLWAVLSRALEISEGKTDIIEGEFRADYPEP